MGEFQSQAAFVKEGEVNLTVQQLKEAELCREAWYSERFDDYPPISWNALQPEQQEMWYNMLQESLEEEE